MAEIKVDVRGETCPVPLVETRKALRKAVPGISWKLSALIRCPGGKSPWQPKHCPLK